MNNNHLNLHYKDACHWLESRIVSVLSCHWLLRPLTLGHNEDQQVQDVSSVFHGVNAICDISIIWKRWTYRNHIQYLL
jgi:hypothetical protein